jgi:hypothetical protein
MLKNRSKLKSLKILKSGGVITLPPYPPPKSMYAPVSRGGHGEKGGLRISGNSG